MLKERIIIETSQRGLELLQDKAWQHDENVKIRQETTSTIHDVDYSYVQS